ncbi:histidine kinase [Xanthomonas cucurbitae]|uniref:Histidine kinase n=1 Tax=Xanthomonas cucurbitae TaxID=56453 RepID=A0A2S7DK93_9XANT|nr:MASE1 domain-containing protein [Xanthomonas cucurbitae]PPU74256.1 histidine kinase [Xanthomonas cucurbitae]WDM81018.1 MASE1 domain-containing protein [Xanthomonas cucurbitae]WDM84702.1 MASE1 domain-containing protein [Xanthomonas cucurbitae]
MGVAREVLRGMLISMCYGLTFVMLWFCSIDQWYLPVGLRVVTLLFRPYREWPFLLVGDAAAMLWLRVPLAQLQGYDLIWAYISPFLHAPMIAYFTWVARRYSRGLVLQSRFLIQFAIAIALCNSLCSIALNTILNGPETPNFLGILSRYWLGSYLGILMFLLPVILWSLSRVQPVGTDFPRDLTASVVTISLVFYSLNYAHAALFRNVLMIALIVPAIFLTRRHGLIGTALGALLANVAVAISISHVHQIGFYDQNLFIVQLVHAIVGAGLFIFGARLTVPMKRVDVISRIKKEAQEAVKDNCMAAERILRSKVVEYSDINVQINRMRKDIVADLRARGHHAAAMEITRVAVIELQLLQEYIASLYPLEIETHGLYRALRSPALACLKSTQFEYYLRGDCRHLSLGLQLAAYRCALSAIELLPQANKHFIQARVWRGRGGQGIAIRVLADTALVDSMRRDSPEVEAEFTARLKSYGGTFRRRHALVLTFLVAEAMVANVKERHANVPRWIATRRTQ